LSPHSRGAFSCCRAKLFRVMSQNARPHLWMSYRQGEVFVGRRFVRREGTPAPPAKVLRPRLIPAPSTLHKGLVEARIGDPIVSSGRMQKMFVHLKRAAK
jgi:hypothetical protein